MDSADVASGSNTHKRRRVDGVGLGIDFISKLPDDILHQILSSLPTKDLVSTSALSTRWRRVWTFFPVIDIDLDSVNEMHELRTGFLDLVEREMLIPPNARVKKFRLNLSAPMADASDVMLWVDKVMEHKVEELDLALPAQTFYTLPDRLFSNNSLATMKLLMDGELTVPGSVCFPRLKVLHLSKLKFSSVRSIQKLFSSCPVLEELALSYCDWDRINSISIHFPSLLSLSIDYDPVNVDDLPASEIKISAPNLLSFKCRAQLPIDLCLSNTSSLEDASVDVEDWRVINPEASMQRAVKLLNGVRGVESLTISNRTLEILSFEKDLHAFLPTFDNVQHLKVDCEYNMRIPGALMELLRKTPSLHSLSMGVGNFIEEEGVFNVVPECFKTSLTRFGLANFTRSTAEMRLLKYLLANAPLLENMSIICGDGLCYNSEEQDEIKTELELSRGAAPNCVIVLS